MNFTEAPLFWGFLLVYGVVMYALSPKSKNANSFYKGADDQGNNNVNAAQAQYEHDQYRGNYGIHGKLRIGIEGIPAPFGRRQHEKCANVQEMAAAVKTVV